MLYSNDCQNITVNDTSIDNNTAKFNSAATLISSTASFDNWRVIGNQAGEATVQTMYSSVKINNTVLDGNEGSLVTNGFQLINSDVEIRNSLVQNSYSATTEAGFFNIMIQSNLRLLENTMIRNITALTNGLLLSGTQSNVTFGNNVTIVDCASLSSEATISIVNSPNFMVNDTYIAT